MHTVTLLRQNFCRVELQYKTRPHRLVDFWMAHRPGIGYYVDGTAPLAEMPVAVQYSVCRELRVARPFPIQRNR